MKGSGRINANIWEIVVKTTSPANILPKSLKESETTFVKIDKISKSPTKRKIGLNEKYLAKWLLIPTVLIAKTCVAMVAIIASARVKLISLPPARKNAINPSFVLKPTVPKPGKRDNQLAKRITTKKLIKYGKIFIALFGEIDSVNP